MRSGALSTESPERYDIRSRPSGGHWIAWLTRSGEDKPAGAVLLVGQTREEAEARAREWRARVAAGEVKPQS